MLVYELSGWGLESRCSHLSRLMCWNDLIAINVLKVNNKDNQVVILDFEHITQKINPVFSLKNLNRCLAAGLLLLSVIDPSCQDYKRSFLCIRTNFYVIVVIIFQLKKYVNQELSHLKFSELPSPHSFTQSCIC